MSQETIINELFINEYEAEHTKRKQKHAHVIANNVAMTTIITYFADPNLLLQFGKIGLTAARYIPIAQIITETVGVSFALTKLWQNPNKSVGEKIQATVFRFGAYGPIMAALGGTLIAGTFALAPEFFLGGLGVMVVGNILSLASTAKEYYSNPWIHKGNSDTDSDGQKSHNKEMHLRLKHKAFKTAGLTALTGLVAVFFFFPVTHIVVGAVLAVTIGIMAGAAIYKTVKQRQLQRENVNSAIENKFNPYNTLELTNSPQNKKMNLKTSYQNKIKKIENTQGLDKEGKTKQKAEAYRAYRILSKRYTRNYYNAHSPALFNANAAQQQQNVEVEEQNVKEKDSNMSYAY